VAAHSECCVVGLREACQQVATSRGRTPAAAVASRAVDPTGQARPPEVVGSAAEEGRVNPSRRAEVQPVTGPSEVEGQPASGSGDCGILQVPVVGSVSGASPLLGRSAIAGACAESRTASGWNAPLLVTSCGGGGRVTSQSPGFSESAEVGLSALSAGPASPDCSVTEQSQAKSESATGVNPPIAACAGGSADVEEFRVWEEPRAATPPATLQTEDIVLADVSNSPPKRGKEADFADFAPVCGPGHAGHARTGSRVNVRQLVQEFEQSLASRARPSTSEGSNPSASDGTSATEIISPAGARYLSAQAGVAADLMLQLVGALELSGSWQPPVVEAPEELENASDEARCAHRDLASVADGLRMLCQLVATEPEIEGATEQDAEPAEEAVHLQEKDYPLPNLLKELELEILTQRLSVTLPEELPENARAEFEYKGKSYSVPVEGHAPGSSFTIAVQVRRPALEVTSLLRSMRERHCEHTRQSVFHSLKVNGHAWVDVGDVHLGVGVEEAGHALRHVPNVLRSQASEVRKSWYDLLRGKAMDPLLADIGEEPEP